MGKRIDLGDGWYADLRERYTWAAARAIEGAMGNSALDTKDYTRFVGYQEAVVMWTVEAASGAILGSLLLDAIRPTALYASPAVAAGHLYVTSERGQTAVLRAGRTPEVVAVNLLENMRASPAFADGRLYFRTELALVAVE